MRGFVYKISVKTQGVTAAVASKRMTHYRTSGLGSFNNYMEKMRGLGSQMSLFVHTQGIKTIHAGEAKKWQNSVHVVVECPLVRF